jgi:allantoinase
MCLLHGDGKSEHLLSDIVHAVPYGMFYLSISVGLWSANSHLISNSKENERYVTMESVYDYGARAGFWRWHRLFTKKKIPCTVFAVGMALERNPLVCKALKVCCQRSVTLSGRLVLPPAHSYFSKDTPEWEVASHGYRWWNYQHVDVEVEREHIRRSVDIHTRLLGKRPVGFYQGKPSVNTRRLVVEEGGFKYGQFLMIVPTSWKRSS